MSSHHCSSELSRVNRCALPFLPIVFMFRFHGAGVPSPGLSLLLSLQQFHPRPPNPPPYRLCIPACGLRFGVDQNNFPLPPSLNESIHLPHTPARNSNLNASGSRIVPIQINARSRVGIEGPMEETLNYLRVLAQTSMRRKEIFDICTLHVELSPHPPPTPGLQASSITQPT